MAGMFLMNVLRTKTLDRPLLILYIFWHRTHRIRIQVIQGTKPKVVTGIFHRNVSWVLQSYTLSMSLRVCWEHCKVRHSTVMFLEYSESVLEEYWGVWECPVYSWKVTVYSWNIVTENFTKNVITCTLFSFRRFYLPPLPFLSSQGTWGT